MRVWWNQRSSREQYFLLAGAGIALLLFIEIVIWRPMDRYIDQTRQQVIQNTNLLLWMTDTQAKLNAWHHAGYIIPQNNTPLMLVALEQSLSQSGLSRFLISTQESSQNTMQVSFTNVPFDPLITWLEMIWVSNNVIVNTISVEKGSTTGAVNVVADLVKYS